MQTAPTALREPLVAARRYIHTVTRTDSLALVAFRWERRFLDGPLVALDKPCEQIVIEIDGGERERLKIIHLVENTGAAIMEYDRDFSGTHAIGVDVVKRGLKRDKKFFLL